MTESNRSLQSAPRRRTPTITVLLLGLVTAVASLVSVAAFGQGTLREGQNFSVVKPAQPTSAPVGKTEVIEFFGYWCPHCYDFEPVMADWAKRNEGKVAVVYMPFAFQPGHVMYQKLYYTLDVLGKEKELRRKVFTAIHGDRSLPLGADLGTLADWAAKNGIDKKTFLDTFNSFSVQTKVNRADQVAKAYGVSGVPMLGIGGKYLINVDARSIGNADLVVARVVSEK